MHMNEEMPSTFITRHANDTDLRKKHIKVRGDK